MNTAREPGVIPRMSKLAPGLAASAVILAAALPAHAGPMEDFAFALKIAGWTDAVP